MSSKASTVGYDIRQPLEEQPPSREQILTVTHLVLTETEQLRQPRLDEAALLRIEQMLLKRRAQLLLRRHAAGSSSAIRQRQRTMSASAQYVTPSP